MSTIKSDDVQIKESTNNFSSRKKILLVIFLGCVLISVLGHFVINNHSIIIITNHLGGIGIIGLLAYLTALIATWKGYNSKKVFLISFFLPVLLGLIAVVIISLITNYIYCGGGVSLATSFILVIIYSIIKKKKIEY